MATPESIAAKLQGLKNKCAETTGVVDSDLTNAVNRLIAGYGEGNGQGAVQSVNGKTGDVVLGASDVGARPSTWTPTYSEVGADQSGAASTAVSEHNTNTAAHNDIRLELKALSERINAALDSDDTTLDELSEIVSYIKSNKTLIAAITESKVNVSDIIDNLVSNVTNKPLSAAQGVVLKGLINTLDADKLDASALTSAINTALAQAKESGEFDGEKGEKGEKGEQGSQGAQGPQGEQGIQGEKGEKGSDGTSITHEFNGTTLSITSASGTSSVDLKGDKGEKGEKGEGFSIAKTYSSVVEMNASYASDNLPLNSFVLIDTGNVADEDNAKLYVKLDSGYSYLTDLSGAQGIKGEKGEKPVKGVDYFTEADKADMVQAVLTGMPDGDEVSY